MTEDFTYYGPALTGRHPHIGPMPADATVLQPAEMAALRASLAALEAALVEAEAERARLVARAEAAEAQLAAVPVETILAALDGYDDGEYDEATVDKANRWLRQELAKRQQPEVQP